MVTVAQALAAADELYGVGSFVEAWPAVHLTLPHLITVNVAGEATTGFVVSGPALSRMSEPRRVELTGRFTGPLSLVRQYFHEQPMQRVLSLSWNRGSNSDSTARRCECLLVNAYAVSCGAIVESDQLAVVDTATIRGQTMLVRREWQIPSANGLPTVAIARHLRVSLRFADEELVNLGNTWPDGFSTFVDLDFMGNDLCVLRYHDLRIEVIAIESPSRNEIRNNPITPAVWLHLRRCAAGYGEGSECNWTTHQMFNADRIYLETTLDSQTVSTRPATPPRRVVDITGGDPIDAA